MCNSISEINYQLVSKVIMRSVSKFVFIIDISEKHELSFFIENKTKHSRPISFSAMFIHIECGPILFFYTIALLCPP